MTEQPADDRTPPPEPAALGTPSAQATPHPPAEPHEQPGRPAPHARWSLLRYAWQLSGWTVLMGPILALALIGGLVQTAWGTAWLLASLDRLGAVAQSWGLEAMPTLRVQGPHGALLAPDFAVDRVEVRWDQGRQSVTVEDARLTQASWRWFTHAGLWASVQAPRLSVRRVTVQTGPSHFRNVAVVNSLAIPLGVDVAEVLADEVVIDDLQPFLSVRGRARMGGEPDGDWHFTHVQTQWHQAQLTGELTMGTTDGLRFEGQVQARVAARQIQSRQGQVTVPAWQGTLSIGGRIDQMTMQAQVQVDDSPVQLRVTTQVRPFQGWPLSSARVDLNSVDLAMLKPGWPRTRLTGHADLTLEQPKRADLPSRLLAKIDIGNDRAGPWSEGQLPIRRWKARIEEASADSPNLLIRDLVLDLSSRGSPGRSTSSQVGSGQLTGEGDWSPAQGLNLRTQWQRLVLSDLFPQAPALQLSGHMDARFQPASNGLPERSKAWSAALKGALQGQWLSSARAPVGVAVDMSIDPQRWHVAQFALRSGGTDVQGALDILGWNAEQWAVQTQGRLNSFDPRPWLGSEVTRTLAQGRTALSGDWSLTARLPRPRSSDGLDLPNSRTLSGEGQFRLQDSWLMGQALDARLTLTQSGSGTQLRTLASGEGRIGPNRLTWEGELDAHGDGSRDRWQARVDAPELGAWSPLMPLMPLMGLSPAMVTVSEQWPFRGQARVSVSARGRWPHVRSQGEARLEQVRSSRLAVDDAQLQWDLDLDDRSATRVTGQIESFRWDDWRLERARLDGRGTLADHRIQWLSDWPYAPSEATAAWLGLNNSPGASTRVQFELKGGWPSGIQAEPARWQGTLDKLWVGAKPTASNPAANDKLSSWVSSNNIRLSVALNDKGRSPALRVAAGQARLPGGLVAEWDDLSWASPAGLDRSVWSVQARLRPFELAPWLQRATPGVTWQGDLRVAASVSIQAAEQLTARVDVGRRQGSLSVNDGENTLDLGVSELRLTARAEDGLWTFSPLFVGKTLGVITGALTLQGEPASRGLDPKGSLDGALHANVPNLAIWRPWLPAGWRLSGELWSTVQLQGSWQKPEVRGELQADRLALRNPLQGVDLNEGRVRLALQGLEAQLTEFQLRGGEGEIRGKGQASLGARPQAEVTVQARQFRLLGRVDRQLTTSGQARLNWTAAELGVDGRIQVDAGQFDLSGADAPSLDRDVIVLRPVIEASKNGANTALRNGENGLTAAASQTASAALTLARPPSTSTRMKLAVSLGERLRLKGRGMDTRLGGDIVLTSPQGRLNVSGSVQTLGGTYAAYGQKLTIERGVIAFSGPVENPSLDILALRPNLDTRVGVAITGTALTPRVRLYSDPDLPESDKLSWLVLGRGSSGLGRADSTVLQRAALALLAGEGEAPTDALLRNLGIDDLSLRQGDGDVNETVVSLGKQISRNWYLGYERSVNAASGTFQLIYRLGQNFTLRAQSGVENALDLIWTWRFNGPGSVREGTP